MALAQTRPQGSRAELHREVLCLQIRCELFSDSGCGSVFLVNVTPRLCLVLVTLASNTNFKVTFLPFH